MRSKRAKQTRVLIVQADPDAASSAAETLRETRFVPIIAANFKQSRDIALRERPDVVLCDLDLPDRFAISLLVFLRSLDERIEVAFTTQQSPLTLVMEAIHEGAADFLERPFSAAQLLRTLEAAVQRGGSQRTATGPAFATSLVLGDDLKTVRTLGNLLGELGIAVCTAEDDQEARGVLEDRIIDLLVIDLTGVPDAWLGLVREARATRHGLPVIALGAFDSAEAIIESYRAGASSVHLKPIGRETFHRAVLAARRIRHAPDVRTAARDDESAEPGRDSRAAELQRQLEVLATANAGLVERARLLEEERDAARAALARPESQRAVAPVPRDSSGDDDASAVGEGVEEAGPVVVLIAGNEGGAGEYRHELAQAGFTVRWYLDPAHALASLKTDRPRTMVLESGMVEAAGLDNLRLAFAEMLVPSLVILDDSPASHALRTSAEVPRHEVLPHGPTPQQLIQAVRRAVRSY